MGRALLADPHFPNKVLQQKISQIRPCIACSQGCTDSIFSGKPVFCLANPYTGFETSRAITPPSVKKNILIIGAGPAGLEAAIQAHKTGHAVEIFEEKPEIGGQLQLASKLKEKHEIANLLKYYSEYIQELHIPLHTATPITIEIIKQKQPDYIIAAEGATQKDIPLQHDDATTILQAWKVLQNDPATGSNIAIIGGGATGLEVALFQAQKGTISAEILHFLFTNKAETPDTLYKLCTKGNKNVTVFETTDKIGSGIGKSTKWITIDAVKRYGIDFITNAKITNIFENIIHFKQDGESKQQSFDTIINATGVSAVQTIAEQLPELGIPFTIIGDSKQPRRISDAIHEGFLAIAELE